MPSKDHQAALELYKSTVELEAELRQLLRQRQPFDKEVATARLKLRDSYEKIIFLDFELAQSKEVEQNLWKYVYYKVIEEFRRIRTTPQNGAKTRSLQTRKLISAFRSFLHEATGFYHSFIQRLAAHFELRQLDPIIKKSRLITEAPGNPENDFPESVKQRAVLSCHKSLIFLGDLARYLEVQSERQRKNWSTASDYYNQARQLLPDSGNPHNQLAVIATYNMDDFAAVYHYYRSLVVRHPFLTAKDNIGLLFQRVKKNIIDNPEKNLDNFEKVEPASRRRLSHQRQVSSGKANLNKQRTAEAIEAFFSEFIQLHSILYLKSDLDQYSTRKKSVLAQLKEHATARSLDSDQLLRIVAINMAALFVICHITNENGYSDNLKISAYPQSSKKALIEKYVVLLALDALSALLDVCNTEMVDLNEELNQGQNATQILPASVKRILAPLRIAFKWIKVSLDYLALMTDVVIKDQNIKNEHRVFSKFWESYAQFLNTLEHFFPHNCGVPLEVPLHEDFEMHGFAALKNEISIDPQASLNQDEPFEEYDMRIYDIIEDAFKIAKSEVSRLYYVDGIFTPKKPVLFVNTPFTATEPEVDDHVSTEDETDVLKAINDVIADHNENDLAESQSFASSSPKALSGETNEDDEEEVILFTGRYQDGRENASTSSVIGAERLSPHSRMTSENTNGETSLNHSLNEHITDKTTEKQSFWNRFNGPQLFTNNHVKDQEKIDATTGQPSIGLANQSLLNQLIPSSTKNSDNVYEFLPFSTSSVPNSAQDPLVPPVNRPKMSAYTTPSNASLTNSTLFAFPGTDGNNFNPFDTTSASTVRPTIQNNTSFNGTIISPRTINPPPGFSSEPIGAGLSSSTQQSKLGQSSLLPQTNTSFGFSQFDIARSQIQPSNENLFAGFLGNPFPKIGNPVISGQRLSGSGIGPDEFRSSPLSLFVNSNSTSSSSTQIPSTSLIEKKQNSVSGSEMPPLTNGWTPTSTG